MLQLIFPKSLVFSVVTLLLTFCGSTFDSAQALSQGVVDFGGSEITSNVPEDTHYRHKDYRKVSNNAEMTIDGERRIVLEEKWHPPGKPPDITIFTLKVLAKGQGRIFMTLNQNNGGPTQYEDVGTYRGLHDPISLENNKTFFLYQYVPHKNIRKYQNGFDLPYDDDCVPVKHKGYNLEVVTGQEALKAVGKATAEKISIAYGTEESAQNRLGLSGGWDSAQIEADFVNGSKRTWGWKLVEDSKNYT